MIRDSSIYISKQARWMLSRLVAAHNARKGVEDTNLTADAMANDIIVQHIKTIYPHLIDGWERRTGIDKEMEEKL